MQSFSQTLTVSSPQLNFGIAYENAPDSLQISVLNNIGHSVDVTGIKFYTTYGVPAFSASSDHFTVPDGSSQNIWIKFSPRHNIFHNSEMVIENNSLRGYVSVDLIGQGKYSNTYYDSTENLSEENLKVKLKYITGLNYDTLGYNFARDSMFMWLDNQFVNGQAAAVNTLEGIYTGILATGYTSRADCQTTFNFNTEHTFPQSLFSQAEPMRSDLHHLFPTDDPSNNYRADNPFGVVTNPAWTSGGSKGTLTLFEPRDQQKGATARAMMYFVIRYQDYSGFFAPQETILRTWHTQFLPTQVERKRNDDILLIQHNRNPFVDYPQFIERIHSIASLSVDPPAPSVDILEDTIVYGFVPQSIPQIFHYVIVNNGNTNVNFTNFNLSNPAILSFQNGGNDTLIAPGDALGIDISLITSSQDSIHESLMFQTDDPTLATATIPIYANSFTVSNVSENAGEHFVVFPNPVKQLLQISCNFYADADYTITDVAGKQIMYGKLLTDKSIQSIDVSALENGIYFLKVKDKSKSFFEKFIKD